MLDVRRMRVLREVARRGSFSAAAEALDYTQSAVSQHVAALERETGATLVERGGRGVRLTDAGRALVEHADAVLARLEQAEEELSAIAGGQAGRLRLASFPSAGAALVPGAVASFRERHPDVRLSLAEMEPEESLPALRTGEVDMALTFTFGSPAAGAPAGLETVHLMDDRMHAALPERHPLAGRAKLRLGDLRDDSWIGACADSSCGRFLIDSCRSSGFDPHIAFEADDYPTMQGLVAAGVGVTLLPDLAVATGVQPGVTVRPLRNPPVRRIGAAMGAAYRSPAMEAMLGILRECAERFARPPALELAAS